MASIDCPCEDCVNWLKLVTLGMAKDRMLQFFAYQHLPTDLQNISRPFCDLANAICDESTGLPSNPERTVALRKLLEAKDCAVRALIYKDNP